MEIEEKGKLYYRHLSGRTGEQSHADPCSSCWIRLFPIVIKYCKRSSKSVSEGKKKKKKHHINP